MNKVILLLVFCITSIVLSYSQTLPYCFNTDPVNRTYTVGLQPACVASADFNGDGKMDLATANSGSDNISILLGAGINTGSFVPVVNYSLAANSHPNSIATGDFNGDAQIDLVVSNSVLNSVSILLGSGAGTFTYTSDYLVGNVPWSIVVKDLNTDGKMDIVTANLYSNNISVLLGTGTGSFSPSVNYIANNMPYDLCTGDFNGDSKIDIAVVNKSSNDMSIFLGAGNGTFANATNYIVGSSPTDIMPSDFNGDGKMDMVVLNSGSYGISILIGNGAGGFAPAMSYSLAYSSNALAVGDFNGDGNIDVSVSVGGSYDGTRYISTFPGTGLGTFSSPFKYNLNYIPGDIYQSDFNNDGNLDLAVAVINATNTFNLSILLGNGSCNFAELDIYPTGTGPISITTADFNSDGIFDLATANRLSGNVSILKGIGNGTFLAPSNYSVGFNPYSIATADFNKDGNPDLAVANQNSSNISILIGSSTGVFAPAVNYNIGNNPTQIATADFNRDGNIDIAVTNPSMNSSPNTVSILLGTSTGTFYPGVSCNTSFKPFAIAVGDLDNDSIQDLIVADLNSNNISTFLGLPTGTFVYQSSYNAVSRPSSLTPKDLNNDSILDLIVTNCLTDSIHVLLGSGTGSFVGLANYKVGTSPYDVGIGDFNSDGKYDLAVANTGTASTVSMLFGIGGALFDPAINYDAGSEANSIVINDFNGDGKDDLAMTMSNSVSSFNGVSIMLNGIPAISITGINSLCVGNTATLTATGAGTYLWNSGITANNIIVSPANTITYSVTGTTLYGCANTAVHTISVSASPLPTVSVNTGTICSGSSFNIVPTGASTYTYSSFSSLVSPTVTSTYTVVGLDTNGCYGTAVSTVIVNALPLVTAANGNICLGNSYVISPTGALNYTYSCGNPVITPSTTTTYTVIGSDLNNCIDTETIVVVVNPLPVVTILPATDTVCINSSLNLIASGAASYNWNNGATTSSTTIVPLISGIYTVTAIDTNNCVNTQTISVVVDNTCQDVWPGDANSDGTADNLDVLELGLHYTQTGAPRASVSNTWQSYFATNWTGTISNGKNLNHSDCNGDGTINDDDTLAIFNNYGLTHAFKPEQAAVINPQLSIVPDQAYVTKGNWGTASIYAGDAITSINNINGLAFTVDFDNTLIETNSIYIEYQNSFLDAGQNLHFRKLDFANGKIFTATTHTINNNVSGNGLIAKLHYQIKSSLTTDEVLNIGLLQANQSNATGVITPLTSGTGTLMAIGASVGLQELNGNVISFSPNPTNGSLTIKSKIELQKIEVVAITGQTLLSEVPTNISHTLHLDNFANGVYFVNLYQNNRIVKREKIVLNK